jgi:hypothetical protein
MDVQALLVSKSLASFARAELASHEEEGFGAVNAVHYVQSAAKEAQLGGLAAIPAWCLLLRLVCDPQLRFHVSNERALFAAATAAIATAADAGAEGDAGVAVAAADMLALSAIDCLFAMMAYPDSRASAVAAVGTAETAALLVRRLTRLIHSRHEPSRAKTLTILLHMLQGSINTADLLAAVSSLPAVLQQAALDGTLSADEAAAATALMAAVSRCVPRSRSKHTAEPAHASTAEDNVAPLSLLEVAQMDRQRHSSAAHASQHEPEAEAEAEAEAEPAEEDSEGESEGEGEGNGEDGDALLENLRAQAKRAASREHTR